MGSFIGGALTVLVVAVAVGAAFQGNRKAASWLMPVFILGWFLLLSWFLPGARVESTRQYFEGYTMWRFILFFLGFTHEGWRWWALALAFVFPTVACAALVHRFLTVEGRLEAAQQRVAMAEAREEARRGVCVICASCGWRGSLGRFEDSGGCPLCGSDQLQTP